MSAPNPATETVCFRLPDGCQAMFAHLAKTKAMTPENVAAVMVYFCSKLLEEAPHQQGADLLTELDFARGLRLQSIRRADQLLGLAEKVLLESQGIHRAMRGHVLEIDEHER